jgi:hypothetical protein
MEHRAGGFSDSCHRAHRRDVRRGQGHAGGGRGSLLARKLCGCTLRTFATEAVGVSLRGMRTRKQRMHEECSRHLLTRLQNPKFVLVFAHVSALFAFVADTGDNTLAELTVDESTGR